MFHHSIELWELYEESRTWAVWLREDSKMIKINKIEAKEI